LQAHCPLTALAGLDLDQTRRCAGSGFSHRGNIGIFPLAAFGWDAAVAESTREDAMHGSLLSLDRFGHAKIAAVAFAAALAVVAVGLNARTGPAPGRGLQAPARVLPAAPEPVRPPRPAPDAAV
jgi:hypothetical protein